MALILVLAACAGEEVPDTVERDLEAEECRPKVVLRYEQTSDGWTTDLIVVGPGCDGWGAGWSDLAPACGVLADAVADACEDVTRVANVQGSRDTLPP